MSEKTFPLSEKMRQLEEIEQFFQQSTVDIELGLKKQKEAQVLAKDILTYLQKAENALHEIELADSTDNIPS